VNVDIAASTQKLFEETYLAGIETLYKVITRMGRRTFNLCMSGAAAMNYPSNSRRFGRDASRISLLSPDAMTAAWRSGRRCSSITMCLTARLPCGRRAPPRPLILAFRFPTLRSRRALQAAQEHVEFSPCADALRAAVDDLVENRIIGWYESNSEVGTRALDTARSLPTRGRRQWSACESPARSRRLAAARRRGLESELNKWFGGTPDLRRISFLRRPSGPTRRRRSRMWIGRRRYRPLLTRT